MYNPFFYIHIYKRYVMLLLLENIFNKEEKINFAKFCVPWRELSLFYKTILLYYHVNNCVYS